MAELTTIARPYAQAVFKRASETKGMQDWSDMLHLAAAVAQDDTMQRVIDSARYTKEQVADLFLEVCGDALDAEARNLVRVLSENRRLALLPEIADVYEAYRAEAESTVEAEMVTAFPADAAQTAKVAQALQARLGRKVNLTTSTDTSLLGGAIIRAGDMVIDGSVRGKLNRLASAVSQ